MRWQAALVAISIAALCVGAADARPRFYPLAGVYGDLRQGKDTDEISGTELIIVGGPRGYVAFFQYWVANAFPPVAVPVRYMGNQIFFDVPATTGECRQFEGSITDRGFDGVCIMPSINGRPPIQQRVILPRLAKSFWQ